MYQFFLNSSRFVAFILFLFLNQTIAIAQNRAIDSLKAELQSAGPKFDLLYLLGYEYIDVDNNMALKYANDAFELAISQGDSLNIVKASRILGSAYRRLDLLNDAVSISTLALEIADRNNFKDEKRILLNSLAYAHTLQGEYDKALDYNFQSLVIREEEGDRPAISIALNNIGLVYFKLRNYEKALEYYNRALELKKESKDLHDLDRLLINIGLTSIQLGKFSQAENFINEGLTVCGSNCDDQIIIEGQFGLGVSNYRMRNYSEAFDFFNLSYELARNRGNKRFQAENLVYLGRVALAEEDFDRAQKFLSEAEELAAGSSYNQLLIDSYKEFSNLYRLSENFQQASFYQTKYIALKDSLIGEELVKNIAKIQTSFEERQNIATIAQKEEVITRQRMLNLAIGIIAVLGALLVFVLFQSNRAKRKANAVIELQNKALQAQADVLSAEVERATAGIRQANESLKKVNDELDNFIYKTSHDIRGPLASLKGMCNVALIDVKDKLALDYLQKLDMTATKLNRILTRLLIINQINSATINAEPLDLDSIVDDIILLETKKGIPARLTFKREIQRNIIFRSDEALIRIILENLIDNAIKFYNDSERVEPFVHIRITASDTHLLIAVLDNGVGISQINPDKIFQMFSRASERSGTGGLGLYLIKQATIRLGGDVGLRTTPEEFTEFSVSLPLEVPEGLLHHPEESAKEQVD